MHKNSSIRPPPPKKNPKNSCIGVTRPTLEGFFFIVQFRHGLFSMFQACVSISASILNVFMNIYSGYVCINVNGHTAG